MRGAAFHRDGHSDLINVRFAPLCGLKPDISLRPRSATSGLHELKDRGR